MTNNENITKIKPNESKYKNWIKIFIQFSFLGIFLFSCKTKTAVADKQKNDSIAVDTAFVDSIKINPNINLPKDANANIPINERFDFYEHTLIHPKFEHIKISGSLSANTLPTLGSTIYIENNQKIWMNLSLFINMARGIATYDGIKAYEKYNSTYIDSNFDYLNNLLNIDFINYSTLQKLLMGRTFIPIKDSQFTLHKSMEGYFLNSKKNQKFGNTQENTTEREYRVSLNYSNEFDLKRVYMQDVISKDELEITYDNWTNFSNYRMPENVKLIIKGKKNGEIILENTKFEDLKMQTPYSVPKNYTKIEIQ